MLGYFFQNGDRESTFAARESGLHEENISDLYLDHAHSFFCSGCISLYVQYGVSQKGMKKGVKSGRCLVDGVPDR